MTLHKFLYLTRYALLFDTHMNGVIEKKLIRLFEILDYKFITRQTYKRTTHICNSEFKVCNRHALSLNTRVAGASK